MDKINDAAANYIRILADGMVLSSDIADDLHDEGYSDDEIEGILTLIESKLRSLLKGGE